MSHILSVTTSAKAAMFE